MSQQVKAGSPINQVANLVIAHLATPADAHVGLGDDPVPSPHPFLDLITKLLQQLLPMLVACFPAVAGVSSVARQTRIVNRPRLGHRLQLMELINQHAPANAPKVALFHAMLDTGANLTLGQVGGMQGQMSAMK